MSWARLDDGCLDHPKLVRLSDAGFRLWVLGLVHCQRHLTDGHIARRALRALCSTPRRERELIEVGLWETADDGVRVHDYLDWNSARAEVLKKRADAKIRGERWRSRRVEERDLNASTRATMTTTTTTSTSKPRRPAGGADAPVEVRQRDTISSKPSNEEIAAFIKAFCELYTERRHGTKYRVSRTKEVPLVRRLLADYNHDRLLLMADLLLRVDEAWIAATDRGIGILSCKANWLDGRLRENGR